jgi:hypothetical protein
MRNYIAGIIALSGLIIFVFGVDTQAQSSRRIVADIPFEFFVGERRLPRGKYEFRPTSVQSSSSALIVRPVSKSPQGVLIIPVFSQTNALVGEGQLAITFNRYGSELYLSSIKLPFERMALQLSKSNAEKQLGKNLIPVRISVGPEQTAGR